MPASTKNSSLSRRLRCICFGCDHLARSRSGFFFVRPVVSVLEFFKVWLGAAYDAPVPLDVWEQKVYNHTLSINPTAVR